MLRKFDAPTVALEQSQFKKKWGSDVLDVSVRSPFQLIPTY